MRARTERVDSGEGDGVNEPKIIVVCTCLNPLRKEVWIDGKHVETIYPPVPKPGEAVTF